MIASDYGYTVEQFKALTMREVDFMLKKMGERHHRVYAARAALHGLKVKMPESARREAVASPEKAALASKIMQAAIERRKAEMNGQ